MPASIKAGARLAPVLIRDCAWPHVPELERVQWLHDPGSDGALGHLRVNCPTIPLMPGWKGRRPRVWTADAGSYGWVTSSAVAAVAARRSQVSSWVRSAQARIWSRSASDTGTPRASSTVSTA